MTLIYIVLGTLLIVIGVNSHAVHLLLRPPGRDDLDPASFLFIWRKSVSKINNSVWPKVVNHLKLCEFSKTRMTRWRYNYVMDIYIDTYIQTYIDIKYT